MERGVEVKEILNDYDKLSRQERTAWDAWFNGGRQNVTQYSNRPEQVSFGKAECEWVSFKDFWLGKVINLGWMTVEATGDGVAKGLVGRPTFIKYRLSPTDKGWDVREAELERFHQRMRDHDNR